jgi:hypothetical protein
MKTETLLNYLSQTNEWEYHPIPLEMISNELIFFELYSRSVITLDELTMFLRRLEESRGDE